MRGILASIFTGTFEGLTQFLVSQLWTLIWEACQNRKNGTSKKSYQVKDGVLFFAKVGLNVTIGALPGALWQIIFVENPAYASDDAPVGHVISGSAAVATTVMAANLGVYILLEAIYQHCCSTKEQREEDGEMQPLLE